MRMLNDSYNWLIWSEDNKALNELDDLNFGLTSDVSLAVPGVVLYDLYKVNYSSPLIQQVVAEWDKSRGFNVKFNGTKIRLRSNFNAIKLKGTVVLTKLETNVTNAEERILDNNLLPHLDAVSRFAYILFLKLQDVYNFTFTFEVTESWGYVMPHGGHDGMVGQLEREEIELGLTPATMFKHRMDTVDFTAPVWKFRTCFIFRHPKTLGLYKALVMPLSPAVWLCTAMLCVLLVAALRLIHQFEVSDWPDTELSWSGSAVLVIGAISQQGLSSTSYRVSVRILSLCLLVLSVVLYAFYGAAIVTSLLTPPAKSIRTIRQLLDSPIGMGVENTAYTRDYFSKSTDALTAELYRKKLRTQTGFMAVPKGIERMRTKNYAFYAEDATLYPPIDKTFSNPEKCELTEIELFPPYLVSCPVQKTSPFRDFVSCGFDLMRERGILYRENKVWHPHRPACVGEKQVARVDLESVMLAYVILGVGVVSSLLILVVERALARIRHND